MPPEKGGKAWSTFKTGGPPRWGIRKQKEKRCLSPKRGGQVGESYLVNGKDRTEGNTGQLSTPFREDEKGGNKGVGEGTKGGRGKTRWM